ncbi:MAG: ribosome maturation factor RimP [Aquabacterium sp.]|nr:MAG: ribosome maturation factor RimP [Aquabacterium sp.]
MERPASPQAAPEREPGRSTTWQQAVERIVVGLGYELVECERSSQGLLRAYIDRIPGQSYDTGEGEFVIVEDCEKVTRQLQYALEVDGIDYARLEVSSPGLDRPLRKEADYVRFAGEQVEITLKQLFQGRKKWRGTLEAEDAGWRLVFIDDAKKEQALSFTLAEVREARLVPVLNFKGRGRREAAPTTAETQGQQSGGPEE